MTDQSDKLDDTTPLGKSVEDVERDSQNLVNSPEDGEDRRQQDERVPAVIPAFNQGGLAGGNFVAAPALLGTALVEERGSGPDDGRNDKEEDQTPE